MSTRAGVGSAGLLIKKNIVASCFIFKAESAARGTITKSKMKCFICSLVK